MPQSQSPRALGAAYHKLRVILAMIRFEHTVFALPFAFTGAFLAAGGLPPWEKMGWILLAMVGGRSAGLGFNRIFDRRYDALNPRTRSWALPSGLVSLAEAVGFTLASLALMFFAAAMLNPLCLKLAPAAAAILVGYPFAKRYTWLAHLFCGLVLAIAPIGAWVAVRGTFDLAPCVISAAIIFWVGGFDTFYALQDREFDIEIGLFSLPQRFGVRRALHFARAFHAVTVALLVWVYFLFPLGYVYLAGVALVAAFLLWENLLVKEDDLSRLNAAFFTLNGWVSVTYFLFTAADVLMG